MFLLLTEAEAFILEKLDDGDKLITKEFKDWLCDRISDVIEEDADDRWAVRFAREKAKEDQEVTDETATEEYKKFPVYY